MSIENFALVTSKATYQFVWFLSQIACGSVHSSAQCSYEIRLFHTFMLKHLNYFTRILDENNILEIMTTRAASHRINIVPLLLVLHEESHSYYCECL